MNDGDYVPILQARRGELIALLELPDEKYQRVIAPITHEPPARLSGPRERPPEPSRGLPRTEKERSASVEKGPPVCTHRRGTGVAGGGRLRSMPTRIA